MKEANDLIEIENKCKAFECNDKVTKIILYCWHQNYSRISSKVISSIISTNKLIDLDWSFGVTASSDFSDHIGKTYLQLKLTIRDEGNLSDTDSFVGKDNNLRELFFELTLEQFYQFLGQMEKCKSYIDVISA